MQLQGRVLQRRDQGEDVHQLQQELLELGSSISERELQTRLFDNDTYLAVIGFQARHHLPQTGIVDERMASLLTTENEEQRTIIRSSLTQNIQTPVNDLDVQTREREVPSPIKNIPIDPIPVIDPHPGPDDDHRYIVMGIVRDADGKVVPQLSVQVYEQMLRQRAPRAMGEGRTDQNGFYQIKYAPPRDERGNPRDFTFVVVVYQRDGKEWLVSPPVYRAQQVEQVNLMEGGEYKGTSEYEVTLEKILPLIGNISLTQLVENEQHHDISFLSGQTGLSVQEIMLVVMAHYLSVQTKLGPEIFYALFKQHLPKNLPESLLDKTFGFTMVQQLVNSLLRGLLATNPETVQTALNNAVDANVVPPWIKRQIGSVIETLNGRRLQYVLDQPNQVGKVSLGQLLGQTMLKQENYNLFATLYDQHGGATPTFWKALSEEKERVSPAEVADLQLTLHLGVLVKNHLPMLQNLKTAYQHGQFTRLNNLAHLDVSQWESLIRSITTANVKGYPPNIDGKTEDEKIKTYAHIIADRFERAYPTTALSGYINRSESTPLSDKTDVLRFFNNNPDLNLRSVNLNQYLKDNRGTALTGIANPEQTVQDIRICQRVLQLAPTARVANALLESKLTSAQRIYSMGKSNLQRTLSANQLDVAQVEKVYANAELKYAVIMARLSEYNLAFNQVLPRVILPPVTPEILTEKNIPEEHPDLRGLFGSVDYCDCSDCQSVYSAAAYMVDLLDFLRQRHSTTASVSAKDILFKRRPDIGEIDLNCPNTNTPLPYIDLVNEVLESDLVPLPIITLASTVESLLVDGTIQSVLRTEIHNKGVDFSDEAVVTVIKPGEAWGIRDRFGYYKVHKEAGALHMRLSRQTLDTAEDLRAHPAYVNTASYDLLRKATYPMTLPFNLWWQEATTYLGQLDVKRSALMEAFQDRTSTLEKPSNLSLAAEFLGIHSDERTLIITGDSTHQEKYWGTTNPVTDLATVAAFLQHATFLNDTGQEYQRLLELLATGFVNPLDTNHSDILRGEEECNTEQQTITKLSPEKLDRAHRFIRLWRKTGWQMWELDLLIRSPKVGNGVLDAACLQHLQHFRMLQDRLKLATEEMLAFYQPLNIETRTIGNEVDDPLYTRLFLNKAVVNPVNRAFEISKVTDAGTTETLTNQLATIQAALMITEEEVGLLLPRTDGKLTLNNLSLLYRYTLLARALHLSVKDLLLLLQLGSITDPFTDLEKTTTVLDLYQESTWAGFTLAQLTYVLTYSPDSPLGLSTDVLTQYLTQLRANLQKTADAIYNSGATPEDSLGKNLAKLDAFKDPQDVKKAIDLVSGVWSGTSAERNTFIDTKFSVFLDPTDAKTKLGDLTGSTPALREAEVKARFAYVLDHLYQFNSVQTISETLGGQFKMEIQTTRSALNGMTLGGKTLLSYFTDPALLARNPGSNDYINGITPANFGNMYLSLIRLHKVATIIGKLKLTLEDFQWLLGHSATYGIQVTGSIINGIDFSQLPVKTGDSALALQSWRAFLRVIDINKHFPAQDTLSFFSILANLGNQNITFDDLSHWTNWNRDDIAAVHSVLNFQYPQDYHLVDTYKRLFECMTFLRKLGIKVETVQNWIKDEITVTESDQIKQTVKSRYEQSQWLTISANLQDGIREKKRQALVDYELANPKDLVSGDPSKGKAWYDSDSLYAYFLVDIEMSACQLTSRIVQANGSIQLFVQRCFLNLEPEVVVDAMPDSTSPYHDVEWLQWKWMQNYRVWEANRKVFLYPENWIEPDLRDDKSPFFKDMENDLHQGEITNDYVEDVFLRYLEKVDDVARLDVCGMYHHYEGSTNVLHVFARTRTSPHVYYYRQWVDGASWTAWEKVDLDIPGDHVIPVVYNRKLYLFWTVFTEKPEREQHVPAAQANTNPPPKAKKYVEIQLAWSFYRRGGWTPKVVSKTKLLHPWDPPAYLFSFAVSENSAHNLFIDMYMSTSKEFNNDRELDANGNPTGPYTNPLPLHNETAPPWHNARFVFDGDVIEVQASTRYLSYIQQHFGTDGQGIVQLSPNPARRLPNGEHYKNNTLTNNVDVFNRNLNVVVLNPQLRNGELVLRNVPSTPFQVLHDAQQPFFQPDSPFFFEDATRAYFVVPQLQYRSEYTASGRTALVPDSYTYTFYDFYHPYTKLFVHELNRLGITGLLSRTIQVTPETLYPQNTFVFDNVYSPNKPFVSADNQTEIVDFSYGKAYALYNWELFFHAPLMVATRLMQNQRFEEAMQWFHYIFDPTNPVHEETPKKYWITKPFYNANRDDYRNQRIENLLKNVNARLADYLQQVQQWRDHPFQPHLIARFRNVAYQWTVVMKYIDNLIAWGDQLFRQDTMESVNQATQLYIMAADILGPRPIKVPAIERHADKSYNELENELDDFGNALEDYENTITVSSSSSGDGATPPEKMPKLQIFYFRIPPNQKLLAYWDVVADRLFKIRHCMNIEGVVRQLSLFAPPIDPALLVQAAAAGLDLGGILNSLSAPLPNYRFMVLVQRAVEFCNDVRGLGVQLLSTLERKDAEALALLRSGQEVKLLQAMQQIRQQEVDEAWEQIGALENARVTVDERRSHYETLSNNGWNDAEKAALGLLIASTALDTAIATGYVLAGGLALIPKFVIGVSGFGGSPEANGSTGGPHFSKAAEAAVMTLTAISHALEKGGSIATTIGSYQRRSEEWDFQKTLAEKELAQIDKEISAATIRWQIAQNQQSNLDLQIQQAQEVDDHMHSKYTNQDLYDWMVTQISTVYFQAYQVAYDIARRAEKAYQYEIGQYDTTYVQFGYWDSLKKGLCSGDKLLLDLRRLESAYLDQNKREYEITKHISLVQIDPVNLMKLKTNGTCTIKLPEVLFDMDYPGHYMRRVKSLSLSIPCVVGPYTSINCTLTLLKNSVRLNNQIGSGYARDTSTSDPRFRDDLAATQSIATSHGQEDNGLFELNFRDERYLPFEGAGLMSEWRIDLPRDYNQFDFSTISDVILHVRYTSRDGGDALRQAANDAVQAALPKAGVQIFDLRSDFPTEWYRFLYPDVAGNDQALQLALTNVRFPFMVRNKTINVKSIELLAEIDDTNPYSVAIDTPLLSTGVLALTQDHLFDDLYHLKQTASTGTSYATGSWTIKLKKQSAADFKSLAPESIHSLYMIVAYETA